MELKKYFDTVELVQKGRRADVEISEHIAYN